MPTCTVPTCTTPDCPGTGTASGYQSYPWLGGFSSAWDRGSERAARAWEYEHESDASRIRREFARDTTAGPESDIKRYGIARLRREPGHLPYRVTYEAAAAAYRKLNSNDTDNGGLSSPCVPFAAWRKPKPTSGPARFAPREPIVDPIDAVLAAHGLSWEFANLNYGESYVEAFRSAWHRDCRGPARMGCTNASNSDVDIRDNPVLVGWEDGTNCLLGLLYGGLEIEVLNTGSDVGSNVGECVDLEGPVADCVGR